MSGAGGSLTKVPQNAVVLRGEDAIFNCSTDAESATGQNPIAWTYDNDIISYSPCTSQRPGFVASASDSATDCNIQALGSWQYGISGAYRCSDGTAQAVATLIVLGERNYSLLFSFFLLFLAHSVGDAVSSPHCWSPVFLHGSNEFFLAYTLLLWLGPIIMPGQPIRVTKALSVI